MAAIPAASDQGKLRQLEKLVDQQAQTIDDLRASRVRLPAGKPRKRGKASFLRVIVGDSHGAHIDPDACRAFLHDLESLRPHEIVLLGDHLDCGGWLAQHHTLGFVPETSYTFEDDVNQTNQFLDAIQQRCPRARIWYIEGNHEHRIVKSILKITLGSGRDAEYLLRLWGPKAVLHLDKRGIDYVRRDETRDGLRIRGAVKLGKCCFTHGKATGARASEATLRKFKANVIHGHTHRWTMATAQSVLEQTLLGCSFGCLCKMAPLWYDTDPTDWTHGYGVQFVEADGSFTTWPVVILDGVSRLKFLTKELS